MSARGEAIAGERDAIVAYLLRAAKSHRQNATALLADSHQSKPEADRHDTAAQALNDVAEQIAEGRHWR